MIFFQRHHAVLTDASRALVLREYWSAFREIPSGKIEGGALCAGAGVSADAILPTCGVSACKGAIVVALCAMTEAYIARAIRAFAGAGGNLSVTLTGETGTAFTASGFCRAMRRRQIVN